METYGNHVPLPQGPPAKTAGRAGRIAPLSRQTLIALHHRSHGLEQMLSPAQGRDDNGRDQGQNSSDLHPFCLCSLKMGWLMQNSN